ncbi:MAG: anion transporter, partial [Candidatus Rokuibacteriota bacterium]
MSGSDWSRALAVAAFIGSYAALGLGRVPGFRVDRTGVAIICATAMVVSGVIGWDEAVASVDAHTLVLLFGMMIVTAYLRLSGFFCLVMAWAIRNARTPLA